MSYSLVKIAKNKFQGAAVLLISELIRAVFLCILIGSLSSILEDIFSLNIEENIIFALVEAAEIFSDEGHVC